MAVRGLRGGCRVWFVGVVAASVLTAGCVGGSPAASPPPTSPDVPAPRAGSEQSPHPRARGSVPPPVVGPSPEPLPTEVTLAFGGDLLPHMPVNAQAARYGSTTGRPYDFAPMLEPLAPVVGAADLALCHLEVPVAPAPERIAGYPSFGSPAELVEGVVAAGYDGCTTASNHSLDRGRDGIAATLFTLDLHGLGHSGTARTAEEAESARLYDVEGIQVASLSYSYGFNGYPIPDDAPWSVNQIDPERIRADAAHARAEGAQLVVVSLHWGDEYRHRPSRYQREVAEAITTSSEVDLVIGHHAHVVQPINVVNGTFVVWGLGNQLSNQSQDPRRDGLTVVVRAAAGFFGPEGPWSVRAIEAVPTWVDRPSLRVLPVTDTLSRGDVGAGLRAELEASHRRTAGVIEAEGTFAVTVR